MTIRKASPDDIIRWADGTVCYRGELHEYTFMSDDYEVITDESPEYSFLSQEHYNDLHPNTAA